MVISNGMTSELTRKIFGRNMFLYSMVSKGKLLGQLLRLNRSLSKREATAIPIVPISQEISSTEDCHA